MKDNLKKISPIAWNIIIGTMFGRMATSMSIPFLAIYLTQVKHVSPAMTGAIVAVSSLVGVFSSFFGGYLSDKYGRKAILILSVFLWGGVFIGYGMAESVTAFFIVNSMNGLCKSLFEPASRALLSDITEPKNRLLIFNLRYTAINAGVTFGPIIGLKLGSANSTFTFFIAGIIYVLYGLSLLISLKSYKRPIVSQARPKMGEAFGIIRKDGVFALTLLAMILSIAGYSQFNSTLPQFFSSSSQFEDGVSLFSYLLALNAVTVIVLQFPLVQFGKKFSPLMSILAGNLIISLSLLGFGIAKGAVSLALIIIIFTIGEVLMFAMTDLFIDEIANPDYKGTYFGAMGFNGLGNVIGPWIGGIVIEQYGTGEPLILFGSLCAVSILGVPAFIIVHIALKKRKSRMVEISHGA
ncbi:MFS transporter [Bacillus sp. M6-12]|uniref:MDR family MFS transporter n=1 Tax=Bacillus sp. M6-12 TaxID=2054166 RepID=UPI000C781762|nr:MFS transporter [Bacillus sp. M6-12]PLS17121.1 MFS transporter [Bacillus sp. M6-12]